ncbi:MBL fold metallo-hydrolase [Candidatus Woesearchaeota archaeon]|nr:MBL fold metallo-hydrolase [Candidatus Woesearchaeota archaeon]
MAEDNMIIKYWGVRGSIPAPLTTEQIREKEQALIEQIITEGGTEKLFEPKIATEVHNTTKKKIKEYLENLPLHLSGTYGGNTTCIEIQARDSPLIMIDAGTGARALGDALLGRLFGDGNLNPLNSNKETEKDIHLFFTHYHWDHLQGFPFFGPSFMDKVKIHFYGKKDARKQLSDVLSGQQQYPNFPVEWHDLACEKEYDELGRLTSRALDIGNAKVTYQELTHPDSVFAYAIEVGEKKFVIATDTEHKDSPDPRLIKIARGADILYYDSQYTPEEYNDAKLPKFDWGHSTFEWAIKNAAAANIRTVVLGHHEPKRDDFKLSELRQRAIEFNQEDPRKIIMAYEGLEQKL